MDTLFRAYVKSHKAKLGALIAVVLGSALVAIPLPLITKYIIDVVLVEGHYEKVCFIAGVFLMVIVVQLGLGRLTAFLYSSYLQDFTNELRKRVSDATLNRRSEGVDAGNLMVVISGDAGALGQISMNILMTFCGSVFLAVGYAIILVALNPPLSFLAFVAFPIYVLWISHVGNRMKKLKEQSQLYGEELLSKTKDLASNVETIQIFGYEDAVKREYSEVVDRVGSFSQGFAMYSNFTGSVSSVIVILGSFVPLLVGIAFVANGSMTVGDLVAFNSYCSMLYPALSSLTGLIAKRKVGEVHASRIRSVLGSESNDRDHPIASVRSTVRRIVLRDFSLVDYSGSSLIEVGNLEIGKGQCILLTGANGCGKTLLLKALSGLYDGYSGEIAYETESGLEADILGKDNVLYIEPGQKLLLKDLRMELYDRAKVPQSLVCETIERLGLEEEIKKLPYGLETPCSVAQDTLSLGNVQKLRIARALVKAPDYLLLDEVLSNVANDQSDAILRAIGELYPDLTMIVVEHRPLLGFGFDLAYNIVENKLVVD